MSEKEAAADASFMVVAGSDTVSNGTTALFRYVVGNKTIQTRLRSEINATFDVGDDLDSAKLAKLPYLDACVQETLRLVPPVPAGMITSLRQWLGQNSSKLTTGPPRYSDKGDEVLGKFIPAGTTVACPTYAMHRDRESSLL